MMANNKPAGGPIEPVPWAQTKSLPVGRMGPMSRLKNIKGQKSHFVKKNVSPVCIAYE
jgi:hypothetical protein